MEYADFKRLLESGESDRVDFKLDCGAFRDRIGRATAELAKDICAMANNGNRSSYIVIGVDDSGKRFNSVENDKLTDDNLQSWCREVIYPPPRLRVHVLRWKRVPAAHANKTFVVIQIGPNARQAFCIAKDLINYREAYCFRRHEVWIRRGATSDLAAPSEIARLIKGGSPQETSAVEPATRYRELPRPQQLERIREDLADCIQELGGGQIEERLIMPMAMNRMVWRLILVMDLGRRSLWECLSDTWNYEHGILVVTPGALPKRDTIYFEYLSFPIAHGWAGLLSDRSPIMRAVAAPDVVWPFETPRPRIPVVVITKATDTGALRDALLGVLELTNGSSAFADELRSSHESINAYLRKWTRRRYIASRHRRTTSPEALAGEEAREAAALAAARSILKLGRPRRSQAPTPFRSPTPPPSSG